MTQLLSRDHLKLTADSRRLAVVGSVATEEAAELAAVGVAWLNQHVPEGVELDLTGVDDASSAALSVLFEWLRACRRSQVGINRIALSAPLKRLASLAELDEVIQQRETLR